MVVDFPGSNCTLQLRQSFGGLTAEAVSGIPLSSWGNESFNPEGRIWVAHHSLYHEVIYPRSHVICQNKWDLDSASRWLVLHSFHSHFASLSAPRSCHPMFKTPKPSTILLWNNSTPAYKEGTFP